MRSAARPFVVLLAAAALAGCGSGSSAGSAPDAARSGTGSASPGTASAPVPTTPTPVVITDDGASGTFTAAPPGAVPTGTGTLSGPPRGTDPIAVLRSIRTAAQPGFDRVVLEFDGPAPGYRAEYVAQVQEDPTGDPVPLAGTAFLQVALQHATLDDSLQGGSRVYPGQRRLAPDLVQLREVAVAGDFEGVLLLGVGVSARRAFRISTLADPSRIVLDLATG